MRPKKWFGAPAGPPARRRRRRAEAFAAQLKLLDDGSAVGTRMDRNLTAAATARAIAATLLDPAVV